MVLNLEKEVKILDKEIEKKELAYNVFLIHATMHTIFMLEEVLSHLSFMVESYSSSLLLIQRQTMSKENSTGLGHMNILFDLSSTRDFRKLLYIIDMMEKMPGLLLI